MTAARFLSWRSPIHSQNAIHDDRSEIYDRANDRTSLMTKPSVPLGLVFSRSGPYAMMGREMEKSVLMAVGEVNQSEEFDFKFTPHLRDPGGVAARAPRREKIEIRTAIEARPTSFRPRQRSA